MKTINKLFSETDCVLLLGEGNFSFAKQLSESSKCRIVATDLLTNNTNDPLIEQNCHHLVSSGHQVYFSVDATKLQDCLQLKGHEHINHILFNFPHAFSKKMKIDLNRQLLKQFFISAHNYISDRRVKVHVTLCSGQSGIDEVECEKRKWSDSWQLPEMASFGNFVIISVIPFCCDYQSFGYRLKNHSFNTMNAKTFTFEKRDHLVVGCGKLSETLLNNKNNLFSNYLVIKMINELKTVFENSVDIKSEIDVNANYLPFVKHWVIIEKESFVKSDLKFSSSVTFGQLTYENDKIIINDIVIGFIDEAIVKLSIEQLARLKWNISDSRILWSKYLYFDQHQHNYTTGSLFNREHSHDISFWINEKFSYSHLLETTLDVFGTILKSIELIDSYEVNCKISKCYRIVYQSVDCALSQHKCNEMQTLLRQLLFERCNLILR